MTKEQEKQIIDKAKKLFDNSPIEGIVEDTFIDAIGGFHFYIYIDVHGLDYNIRVNNEFFILQLKNGMQIRINDISLIKPLHESILERYNAQKDMEKQNAINEFLNYELKQ